MTVTSPGGRGGVTCGLLTCVLWAPLALVGARVGALASAAAAEGFWRENRGLMQAVALPVSAGFLTLLALLAALADRLRQVDGMLAALAFGSALMFMTALDVAIGLDFAAGLLLELGTALTLTGWVPGVERGAQRGQRDHLRHRRSTRGVADLDRLRENLVGPIDAAAPVSARSPA